MKDPLTLLTSFLLEKKLSIAFAESATAGSLAYAFSLPAHAGNYLKGSIVCYDAYLKTKLLAVDPALIHKFSPESPEVTRAITVGLAQLIAADIHVGITGLPSAGGSENEEKPVGTMFSCAYLHQTLLFEESNLFTGSGEEIINKAIIWTATSLRYGLKNAEI